MRRWDEAAIASGTPGIDLMRRAGRAVADAVLREGAHRILILCGPGNNGGDGYVAAPLLRDAGRDVSLAALAGAPKGDAALAAGEWDGAVLASSDADPATADLVVDALFGTGLARDLEGDAADLVARINASGTPVLAVDVPSGIDADSGAVRGIAINATRTIALAARKPGHLLQPGRTRAGLVEIADIGIAAQPGAITFANGPALWMHAFPQLRATGHKYDRGHALIVSGGPAHTGAARLAARGALRSGAGLVSVVTSARALAVHAAHLTAIMMRVCDDPDEFSDLLTDDRFNTLVLGPALGVGEATRSWVEAALEADRATVLDADALTSFAGEADALAALIDPGREAPVVLTPHDGEFSRLFGKEAAAEPSRLVRARLASEWMGAIVVLKGPDTVIASPDGRAAINENGSAHLATAGTGDVLCGFVAGLLAQGMPGFEAAAAAVWLHAAAAERFGPGLVSEDLPEMLPAVLRDLLA
jgi:NAD(P)H-hydrate epimerase